MSSKRSLLVILVLSILLFSNLCGVVRSDRPSQQTGNLSGFVRDTLMNPIEGALVRVYFHETYEENFSDSQGFYHVTNIPLCYCMKNATCSKPGYKTEWVWLSIGENTTYNFILTALNQTCYPVFNGTMGLNGWYISCVNSSFVINGDVDAVFYKLDSGMWIQYTGTFAVCQSGPHSLYWYWTYQGEESATMFITLLIDRNYPVLHLSSDRISINKIQISAEASDETTGINRIEFFVDGALQSVDYTIPYDCVIGGIKVHHVKAVAFDNAGNSANSTLTTSLNYQNSPHTFLSLLFRMFFSSIISSILNS